MRAIVTVLGKDDIGILSFVTALLAEHKVSVLDISQTILRNTSPWSCWWTAPGSTCLLPKPDPPGGAGGEGT